MVAGIYRGLGEIIQARCMPTRACIYDIINPKEIQAPFKNEILFIPKYCMLDYKIVSGGALVVNFLKFPIQWQRCRIYLEVGVDMHPQSMDDKAAVKLWIWSNMYAEK